MLAQLAEGRTNKQIAETLFISAKTGASNRTEAVGIARRHGLLDATDR